MPPVAQPSVAEPLPVALRRQAWAVSGFSLAAGLLLGWLLQRGGWPAAPAWLALSLLCLAGQTILLHRHLPLHRPSAPSRLQGAPPRPLPALGSANLLTLARGVAIAWLCGFLAAPRPTGLLGWLPALLYTLASLIDIGDGIVARRSGYASALGSFLDLEFDALGVLIVSLLVVRYAQVPAWYVIIGLARYLFIGGVWLRQRLGRPAHPIPPSLNRRAAAGLQMSLFSVLLWPIVAPPATLVAALVFGVTSLAIFARDWLVVSGRVSPTQVGYLRWRGYLLSLSEHWLPLLCRLACLALALSGLMRLDFNHWWGRVGLFSLALVVPGFIGRLGAVGLIAFAAFSQGVGHYPAAHLALLVCACWLAAHGSGAWALWQPEEAIFDRRWG